MTICVCLHFVYVHTRMFACSLHIHTHTMILSQIWVFIVRVYFCSAHVQWCTQNFSLACAGPGCEWGQRACMHHGRYRMMLFDTQTLNKQKQKIAATNVHARYNQDYASVHTNTQQTKTGKCSSNEKGTAYLYRNEHTSTKALTQSNIETSLQKKLQRWIPTQAPAH